MTKVALVAVAVPGESRGLVLVRSIPANKVLGHDALPVHSSQRTVDLVTIEIRCLRTGAGLKVMRQTSGRDVCAVAEGARNICATMDARSKVLRDEVDVSIKWQRQALRGYLPC